MPGMRQRAILVSLAACLAGLCGVMAAYGMLAYPADPAAPSNGGSLLLAAVLYDGLSSGDFDEAIQVANIEPITVSLAGWRIGDGKNETSFPAGELPPYGFVWVTRRASAFTAEFGFKPAYEYGGDTDATVPDMQGKVLLLNNSGGIVTLVRPDGVRIDTLVYKDGVASRFDWTGPGVQPVPGFAEAGQILYRRMEVMADGGEGSRNPLLLPVEDTNTREDWAQTPMAETSGGQVRYPGWPLESFFMPVSVTTTALMGVAVAPDNAYQNAWNFLIQATRSISLESYTFEHPGLAQVLADKARTGVSVTLLLEGDPVGGIPDEERWLAAQISAAGGKVLFMVNDRNGAHDRYQAIHAKFALVDDSWLLVSSENWTPRSMPFQEGILPGTDTRQRIPASRRGYLISTNAPALVQRAAAIFAADAGRQHSDIYTWNPQDVKYGLPPVDFTPVYTQETKYYTIRAAQPLETATTGPWMLIAAPEGTAGTQDEVLKRLDRAGPGDEVLVEQLDEPLAWGAPSPSTPWPNPRIERYIAAARRGARVTILLDSFFTSPYDSEGNNGTRQALQRLAQEEGLDLQVRLGNPTGLGIHGKLILMRHDTEYWVHIGSLNGSETSAKNNRELVIQVESAPAYAYLARIFWWDWQISQPQLFLPLAGRG
ncbi:MAG: lamin tail domain-containing protein [Chloroflexi bacterium]|nr:lamin tail domain-containing protein [Chloroflexota bacterium]